MRVLLVILLPVTLGGCVVGTIAGAAVEVATLPVKVVAAGVDAATTSQAEADQKRGRELRRQEEERGRQMRMAEKRCRAGKPLPTDNCSAAVRR